MCVSKASTWCDRVVKGWTSWRIATQNMAKEPNWEKKIRLEMQYWFHSLWEGDARGIQWYVLNLKYKFQMCCLFGARIKNAKETAPNIFGMDMENWSSQHYWFMSELATWRRIEVLELGCFRESFKKYNFKMSPPWNMPNFTLEWKDQVN